MKKNTEIKFLPIITTLLSLLSLIIAVISIYFSYYVYIDQKKEKLDIQINRIAISNKLPEFEYYGTFTSDSDYLFPTLWECIISNNCNKQISILDHNIWQTDIDKNSITYYKGFWQGIFNSNGNLLEFPFNIEPGNYKKIFIKLGIRINDNVIKILKSEGIRNINYENLKDIEIILAKNGKDIFNNEIKYNIQNDKVVSTSVPRNIYEPKFIFILKSSTGIEFENMFSIYNQQGGIKLPLNEKSLF